jgi:hypothetical protein
MNYLMDVCLVDTLSERVAFINVRNLLQHLANLPCELQVGSCEAYRNLYFVRSLHSLVCAIARWHTYCRYASDDANDG